MESLSLCTAANTTVVCDQSLQHWLRQYVQENTTLFGRTHEANGWPSIAKHYFHGVVVHWVVKLLFSNKFFSDQQVPADAKGNTYDFHVVWLQIKLLFCIILLCFIFIQIPWSFSFSWAFVGQIKSIKETLLKGIW